MNQEKYDKFPWGNEYVYWITSTKNNDDESNLTKINLFRQKVIISKEEKNGFKKLKEELSTH